MTDPTGDALRALTDKSDPVCKESLHTEQRDDLLREALEALQAQQAVEDHPDPEWRVPGYEARVAEAHMLRKQVLDRALGFETGGENG